MSDIAVANRGTILRSRDDLLAAWEAKGVPAGPVNDTSDVMADRQA